MKKRMTGIIFALALTAGFTGCGGGKEADVPATTEAVETTTEAEKTTAATAETTVEAPETEETEKLYCWVMEVDGKDYCLRLNDDSDVWIRPDENTEIDEEVAEKDWLYVECSNRETEGDRKIYTQVSLIRHIYSDEVEANWNQKKKGYLTEISDDRILMDADGFEYTLMISADTDVQSDLAEGDYVIAGLPYNHEDSSDFVLNDVEWVIKGELPKALELTGRVEQVNGKVYLIRRTDGSKAQVFINSRTDLGLEVQVDDIIRVTYGIEASSGDTYACSMVYSVEKAEEGAYKEEWNVSLSGYIKSIDGNKIVFDVQDFDMTIIASGTTVVEEGLAEGDYIRAEIPHFSEYPEGYVFDNAVSVKKEETPKDLEATGLVQFINEEEDVYLLLEDGSAMWLLKARSGELSDGLKLDTVVHVVYGGSTDGNCWGLRSVEKASGEGWNTEVKAVLTNIIDYEYVLEIDGEEFSAIVGEDTSVDESLEPGDTVSVKTSFKELPQEGTFWSVSEIKKEQ